VPSSAAPSPCGAAIADLPATFVEIGHGVAATGARASLSVGPDGLVVGRHSSGGPPGPPTITEQHGCVSPACVRAVWKLAETLRSAVAAGQPPSLAEADIQAYLSLRVAEGKPSVDVRWPSPGNAPTPASKALDALLGEMGIGYW